MDRALEEIIEAYDGLSFIYDNGFSYEMEIKKVSQSSGRPFGVKYEFKLFDERKNRILCFDNAHGGFTGYKKGDPYDHWHKAWNGNKFKRSYNYIDSNKLINDFFKELDKIIDEIEGDL